MMVACGGHSDIQEREAARRVASLPMRLGGLGFRSARRMAPAAYWASWADCLSMLSQRLPDVTEHINWPRKVVANLV